MDEVVRRQSRAIKEGRDEPDYDCELGWQLECGHYEANLCPCPNAVHIKGYGDQA